ncbi:MAG: hypothetical protein K6G17_09470 [Oscillospiraceae bacterium]|nr:hypothetical protein [Oscillospiraceae bacterium]
MKRGVDREKAWAYYELGRAYNNSLSPNQYQLVNTNVEFFAGNQWLHIPESAAMSRLARPTFNIIKRVASLFVASLTSSAVTVCFEPLSYSDGENLNDPESNASVYATAELKNLFEKFKMDYRVREALLDGAQTGDYCAHFYWDPEALPYGGAFGDYRGEIRMELVDGVNVMFGNPNSSDVESQPYILLVGRDSVENLKEEARRWRERGGAEEIRPDAETGDQTGIGGKTELEASDDKTGKALYLIVYSKETHEESVPDGEGKPQTRVLTDENGEPLPLRDEAGRPVCGPDGRPCWQTAEKRRRVTHVHVTKVTRDGVIYEGVDTGLSRYPLAWGNWEKQKNQYHGRALVTGIVPNQIFINSMMALVFRHLQLQSFPKTLYNADLIAGWDNEVGSAIGVRNLPPEMDLRSVAANLQPADMSGQIMLAIDKALAYTKECLGATDAQLGNVRPDNTSALMVLQSSSEVPLENVRAGLHEWLENVGGILLDMMGTYYGRRPLLRERRFEEPVPDAAGLPAVDPQSGRMRTRTVSRRVIEDFDFTQFKNLWLNVAVNVGATTYYSEIAMVQTLDNLRRDGVLEVVDYLERIPDKLIPRKQELIESIRSRAGQPPAAASDAGGEPAMGGRLDEDKLFGGLTGAVQARYEELPGVAQRALIGQAAAR